MTVNERVRYLRKNILRLNQTEFGAALHLSQMAISWIERGDVSLTSRNAEAICNQWNVRAEWLLDGEGLVFSPLPPVRASSLRNLPLGDRAAMEALVLERFSHLCPEGKREFFREFGENI